MTVDHLPDMGDIDRTTVVETTSTETVTVSINGGPHVLASLVITTRVMWMPTPFPLTDPHWEFIDGAGHWHGFAEGVGGTPNGVLPTLESKGGFKRCGGCADVVCRGWHPPAYRCELCHETVVPVFRYDGADLATADIPMVGGWYADLAYAGPAAGRVQVRLFPHSGDILIGAAEVIEDGRRLLGSGELATRGAAALKPLAFHQVGPA